jgi:Sister chromatid cohesion protein Dcc1
MVQDGKNAAVVPYTQPVYEFLEAPKRYSLGEIRGVVQASDAQLEAALKKLNAFELDGKWYTLDERYYVAALDELINLAVSKVWSFDSLPLVDCCTEMSSTIRPEVTRHILRTYALICTCSYLYCPCVFVLCSSCSSLHKLLLM